MQGSPKGDAPPLRLAREDEAEAEGYAPAAAAVSYPESVHERAGQLTERKLQPQRKRVHATHAEPQQANAADSSKHNGVRVFDAYGSLGSEQARRYLF